MTEHASDISDDRLGRHGSVGNDLGYAVTPVALADVIDHAVTAVHAEVDIEIRHRNALRIQESLEQQFVFDRIEIGNAQGPGDQ